MSAGDGYVAIDITDMAGKYIYRQLFIIES
jgi:hypothetical protein